jgi:hypothetical protein
VTAIVEIVPSAAEVLGLEPEKARAAILLASGMPIGKVAAEVGVDRRTLFVWRQTPAFAETFRRELASQNALMREALHARALALTEKAMDVVASALEAGGAQALQAARIVLGRADGPVLEMRAADESGSAPSRARELSTAELLRRAREIRRQSL